MKPMLASDAGEIKNFPLYVSPKIDGIRVIIKDGIVYSRSLKPIPNKYVQQKLSLPCLNGLDGEIVVGSPVDKNCMQNTSSGIMSREGEPKFTLYVFDYWTDPKIPFKERYKKLINQKDLFENNYVKLLDQHLVNNENELLSYEDKCLSDGFEGVMLRIPDGIYKYGRSTQKQAYLLKLKRFLDSEAEILDVEELMHNENELEIDNLGYAKRSSCKDGKVPADTLGSLVVKDTSTGIVFNIGSGFDQATRDMLWDLHKKELLIGKIVKYKFFTIGIKEAPRFPIYIGIRDLIDL